MLRSGVLIPYILVALVGYAAGAALTAARAQQAEPAHQAPAPDLRAEQELLRRFVGSWEGEGEARARDAKRQNVTKQQRGEWALGKRFIHIRSRSLSGDDFQSEAYLWFNPTERRYELYEFNNGPYPVTTWTGQRAKDRLVLEGKVAGRLLHAAYLWLDENRMQVLMSDEKGEAVKSYAGGTFRRVRSRGLEERY